MKPCSAPRRATIKWEIRRRFFISYADGEERVLELARFLYRSLTDEDHKVFFSRGPAQGSDWVDTIQKDIKRAECLVVLLSEGAMDNEALHEVVRLAHHGRKAIVPIRVAYDGSLDYELEKYLGDRRPFIAWADPDDNKTVVDAVIQARTFSEARRHRPADWQHAEQAARPARDPRRPRPARDPRRPRPAADPRPAYVPGGTIESDDDYYLERDADHEVRHLAAKNGATLIIMPHQMGKSSLLLRYLDACRENEKRIVLLDFSLFAEDDFADYPTFLSRVIEVFQRGLGIKSEGPPSISSQAQATWFMEDQMKMQRTRPDTLPRYQP